MNDAGPVLVANAPLRWTRALAAVAEAGEPLLAADGGANHLARLGLKPQAVIGDFDSIMPGTRAWVGEERLVHRPDQDRTDLEKALTFAFDGLKLDRLTVLAALGGRHDHAAGNLGLLARLCLGLRLVFRGDGFVSFAVTGRHELEASRGETWSFWSFDPRVRVTLDGVRWPVREADLSVAARPSISNVAEGGTVVLLAEHGPVVVTRFF
ncbi:MAG: thiamine diphosphokinase [Acidobacteria bacterium]|nr:thiamine diphosphokinase [Acidobacteriota bacterium]